MKSLEAVIPNPNVRQTIDRLRALDIEDVVVEAVTVFKKDQHQTLVFRGHRYEQEFAEASRIRFRVADECAAQAETIVSHATGQ